MARKKIYYCNKYTKRKYFIPFVKKIFESNSTFMNDSNFKSICRYVFKKTLDFYIKNEFDQSKLGYLPKNPIECCIDQLSKRNCGPAYFYINKKWDSSFYKILKQKHVYNSELVFNTINECVRTKATQFYSNPKFEMKVKIAKNNLRIKELENDFI